jgi:UDP-N-acetylmuramate: L-alanyl-gamma-D-glutamyl-meso-diaminopimelate ligase
MSIINKRIHFIAIGGGAMHQLAIALKNAGNSITGSDDEIFEPSRTNLEKSGLLPAAQGWFPEKITGDIDLVVLGMHARADNPELAKAKELNLNILSYPQLIFEHSANKQRVVIAGSHGKTTITAMIMHVLKCCSRKFDYLVGAQVPGFEYTVRLSEDAPTIIIEGDEYLSSVEQGIPKFLVYKHHIGLVSGIAWDHINVFPTENAYVRQFDHFADATPKAGILVYNDEDAIASVICKKEREDVTVLEYGTPKHVIRNGQTFLINHLGKEVPVKFFGHHNVQNANGARTLLVKLGVHDDQFFEAIQSFDPASRRLEKVAENPDSVVFRDFAHAPSKLKATTESVKEQYKSRKLLAVMELHTFSSLNKAFIQNYAHGLDAADEAFVYFNPEVVMHKSLEPISAQELKDAFQRTDLQVFDNAEALFNSIKDKNPDNTTLLLMSSGNFNGTDISQFAHRWIGKKAQSNDASA